MTRALVAATIAVGIVAASAAAHAQQDIFQEPSVDVLDPGSGVIEIDALMRHSPADDRMHFEGATPRLVWGPGAGVEIGIAVGPFGADHADPNLVPSVKLRLFQGGGPLGQFTGALGGRMYLPFVRRHSVLFDVFGILAWRIGPLRLSGGGYLDNWRSDLDAAWLAAGEIFLGQRVRLAVEWWQHRTLDLGFILSLGAADIGVAYVVSPAGRSSDGVFAKIGARF